jgi:hypothetical protein
MNRTTSINNHQDYFLMEKMQLMINLETCNKHTSDHDHSHMIEIENALSMLCVMRMSVEFFKNWYVKNVHTLFIQITKLIV